MNTTVNDLMIPDVVTATPEQTVGEMRELMREGSIHAVPVVDGNNHPVGMFTSNDLLEELPDDTLLARVVDPEVYTVPRYDGVHIAARIMRNHRIHHLVVTHEHQIAGIISSFDLLKLVEEHRFVMKNGPAPSKRGGRRLKARLVPKPREFRGERPDKGFALPI